MGCSFLYPYVVLENYAYGRSKCDLGAFLSNTFHHGFFSFASFGSLATEDFFRIPVSGILN